MYFKHSEIEKIDAKTMSGIADLLAHLCGESIAIGCISKTECGACQGCMNWTVVSERLKLEKIRSEDLNDILILVDQFPILQPFFELFLSNGNAEISFEELKTGIANFEGHAVLLFGNIRFAYRRLRSMGRQELQEELQGLDRVSSEIIIHDFRPRRDSLPLPAAIDSSLTWLLGYIAKNKANRDIVMAGAMVAVRERVEDPNYLKSLGTAERHLFGQFKIRLGATEEWQAIYPDFEVVKRNIHVLQNNLMESRRKGWLNTSHYLALDYMDVYVATSMRERWEFEDVNRTATEIFSHPTLSELKLRYFDPTQSFLENRVDKGLVEALMLKRALCTIYMAQETDTFGKDSELATTLAQGKPVIVFVPEINVEEHTEAANARPLAYLQRRLPQLLAEERIPPRHVEQVLAFLKKTASFDPYFQIVGSEEQQFLSNSNLKTKNTVCARC